MEQKVKEWRSERDIPHGIQVGLPIMDFILALTDSYDAIVMNPPYMGGGKMDNVLAKYVKDIYPDSKADLMTVFMEVAINRTVKGGFWAMINLPSWMFLGSFEEIRKRIISNQQIIGLNQNGRGIFGSDFGSVTFVIQNLSPYKPGLYRKLFKEHVQVRSNAAIQELFFSDIGRFSAIQTLFEGIPGMPIAYWIKPNLIESFSKETISKYGISEGQNITGDNNKYIRYFWEVNSKISGKGKKWVPMAKGGDYRKWYGNIIDVIDWSPETREEYRRNPVARIQSQNLWYRDGITWNLVSSAGTGFRILPNTVLFNKAAPTILLKPESLEMQNFLLAFLNSYVVKYLLSALNPTINTNIAEVFSLPVIEENTSAISQFSKESIEISKEDWDAHETSWDFQRNGLLDIDVYKAMSIVHNYSDVSGVCIDMAVPEPTKLEWLVSMNKMNWEAKFIRLHANEEEINRQFIEIYGLQDELNPHVDYEDITILQQGEISLYRPTHGIEFYGSKEEAVKHGEVLEDEGIVIESQSRIFWQDDILIKQLISYMVGVWMGRYRLDRPGLNVAHPDPTEEEMASYQYGPDNATLVIDDDGIIPVLPTGAPFEDNLTEYIANFVRIAWGEESQTDNLNFIEQCLGKKIENYVQKDFWKDHKKMYQNRPIYWLFSSKKGAFKALVYVHRMHPYTVEHVRTRYLLKYMDWLRSEAQRLEIRDADLTTAERRRLDRLRSDIEECEEYHERLQVVAEQAIPIDLDNGIPANHALFGDIVTKLR